MATSAAAATRTLFAGAAWQGEPMSVPRLLVLLALAAMALGTAFGDRGLLRLFALRQDLRALLAANERLAEDNRRLAAAVARLRDDPRALETAARHDLGLVGPDEVVFEFPE